VLVGAVRVLRNAEGFTATQVLLWVGIPLAVVIIAAVAWPPSRRTELVVELPEADMADLESADTVAGTVVPEARGTYPIPPLDLVVPVPPIRAAQARRQGELAPVGTGHDLPGGSDVVS
jgi:NADH-quinone oxidoreductase subunit H